MCCLDGGFCVGLCRLGDGCSEYREALASLIRQSLRGADLYTVLVGVLELVSVAALLTGLRHGGAEVLLGRVVGRTRSATTTRRGHAAHQDKAASDACKSLGTHFVTFQ